MRTVFCSRSQTLLAIADNFACPANENFKNNTIHLINSDGKIVKSLPEEKAKDLNWSYGLPGERFQKALCSWTIDQISNEYYRMSSIDNQDLKTIITACGLNIPSKLFTLGELRALKSSVVIF